MLASTSLNIASIFLFSTVLLYSYSGEDMVRIQEKAVDDVRNDFQVVLGVLNATATEDMRRMLPLPKLRELYGGISKAEESKRVSTNNRYRMYAYLICAGLVSFSGYLYWLYPAEKAVGFDDYLFTMVVTVLLFISEIYVYFEVIRKFAYNTKERLYKNTFKELYSLYGVDPSDLEKVCER